MSLMMPDGKSWTQPWQGAYGTIKPETATKQAGSAQQGGMTYNQTVAQPKSTAPNMSAYSPGKAQPVQSQSTGTPYGGGTMYAGGTPNFNERTGQYTGGSQPPAQPPADYYLGGTPNFDERTGQYTQPKGAELGPGVFYGGKQIPGDQQQALATALAMRDAMAVQVTNNNLKYEMANAFKKDLGQPTFDYDTAMKQAQDMVSNGFYNPFSEYYKNNPDPFNNANPFSQPSLSGPQPPIGGFTPPFAGMPTQPIAPPDNRRTAIQDLFSKNNIQAPPEFMDQLIGILSGSAPQPAIPSIYGVKKPPSPMLQMPPNSGVDITTMRPNNGAPSAPPKEITRYQGPSSQKPRTLEEMMWPEGWKHGDPLPTPPEGFYWDERSNLQYSGKYDPREYYDDAGNRANLPIMEFVPSASAEDRQKAYDDYAAQRGFYKRDESGKRIGGAKTIPQGRAQPIQPPSQGTPYGQPMPVLKSPDMYPEEVPYNPRMGKKVAPPGAAPPSQTPVAKPGALDGVQLNDSERSQWESLRSQLARPDIKKSLISFSEKSLRKARGGAVEFTPDELLAQQIASKYDGLTNKMTLQDERGQEARRAKAEEVRKAAAVKRERDERLARMKKLAGQ